MVDRLFETSGPILRYRVARDLIGSGKRELKPLLKAAIQTQEVQRWMSNLENARAVHGSTDLHAENALAKLIEYGLARTCEPFDQGVRKLLERPWQSWDEFVLRAFLVRAGYVNHPFVGEWYDRRLSMLFETAKRGDFNLYLTEEEAKHVPKAWRGKPIYRPEFGHESGYALPTCYDLYAMAYAPPEWDEPCNAVAAYLSDPRFQGTVGGYGWARELRRCYAAGRVFLACAEPNRLLLFLEWAARFPAARESEWFRNGVALLETYRTPQGSYRFSLDRMAERAGYYIYGGSHMGLGEDRREPGALERESTFRTLLIQKRIKKTRGIEPTSS